MIKLALVLLAFSATAAWSQAAEPASTDWHQGFNNRARLLAGRAVRDGRQGLYAGVEIEMPNGWDTYWRSPGEAGGVAPEFDWKGSENLESAHVLYPAPRRLRTKAGDVVGYTDRVVFPVSVTPKDAGKPIYASRHGCLWRLQRHMRSCGGRAFRSRCRRGIGASKALTDVLARVPRSDARLGIDPVACCLAPRSVGQAQARAEHRDGIATCRCVRRSARRPLRAVAEAGCRRRKGRVRGRLDRRRRSSRL